MKRQQFAITITTLSLLVGLVIFYTTVFGGSTFIRFHFSDIVIVLFLYGLWSFTRLDPIKKALATLTIAMTVEGIQYFYNPETQTALEELIIGSTFDLKDVVMYVIGAFIAVLIERKFVSANTSSGRLDKNR